MHHPSPPTARVADAPDGQVEDIHGRLRYTEHCPDCRAMKAPEERGNVGNEQEHADVNYAKQRSGGGGGGGGHRPKTSDGAAIRQANVIRQADFQESATIAATRGILRGTTLCGSRLATSTT